MINVGYLPVWAQEYIDVYKGERGGYVLIKNGGHIAVTSKTVHFNYECVDLKNTVNVITNIVRIRPAVPASNIFIPAAFVETY